MRKKMTKQVTQSTIKSASIEMVDGHPMAKKLPDIVVLGNVNVTKAQRIVDKEYFNATVIEVQAETNNYEMLVEDYIKLADKVDKK